MFLSFITIPCQTSIIIICKIKLRKVIKSVGWGTWGWVSHFTIPSRQQDLLILMIQVFKTQFRGYAYGFHYKSDYKIFQILSTNLCHQHRTWFLVYTTKFHEGSRSQLYRNNVRLFHHAMTLLNQSLIFIWTDLNLFFLIEVLPSELDWRESDRERCGSLVSGDDWRGDEVST